MKGIISVSLAAPIVVAGGAIGAVTGYFATIFPSGPLSGWGAFPGAIIGFNKAYPYAEKVHKWIYNSLP